MNFFVCLNCNKEGVVRKNRTGKYCNHHCQRRHQYKLNVEGWLLGEILGWKGQTRQLKSFVKQYLQETRGTACEECGWDKKHPVDGATLTEVDHIDGNAENCVPENLKILCPNCHSMTPTFRNRNSGSKRKR